MPILLNNGIVLQGGIRLGPSGKKCCCTTVCLKPTSTPCCFSTTSTVTGTWNFPGSTSSYASGSMTAPFYNVDEGVTYVDPAYFVDGSDIIYPRAFTTLYDTEGCTVSLPWNFVVGSNTGGDVFAIGGVGNCCGVTSTTINIPIQDADGTFRRYDGIISIIVNNNPCCCIFSSGSNGGNFCGILASSATCSPDATCDFTCDGCCATYRIVFSGGTAFDGTYDLAKMNDLSKGCETCFWFYNSVGIQIALYGNQIQLTTGGGSVFIYWNLADQLWTGCPTETTWTVFKHSVGTTIPTMTVTTLDCPEEDI